MIQHAFLAYSRPSTIPSNNGWSKEKQWNPINSPPLIPGSIDQRNALYSPAKPLREGNKTTSPEDSGRSGESSRLPLSSFNDKNGCGSLYLVPTDWLHIVGIIGRARSQSAPTALPSYVVVGETMSGYKKEADWSFMCTEYLTYTDLEWRAARRV